MIHRSLILLLALGGCASSGNESWPSLATRPGEVQPLVQRPAITAATAEAPPAPRSAATSDAEARLSSLERDITALAARIATQRKASTAATSAAGGQAASTEAGATAEVEATRAARLASQAGDLRDRLDALAGDLARRGAAGEDVSAPLKRLGAAIDRVEALRTPR
ncbi:hypothetical protein [Glacieibacterium frigidum]|uniref:Uncharacterized protein n=1 Tax=Glacieibacterium frigidum TaxID=2593303 RepID=A0A552U9P0_9SPHN|nr:hypothetical protein [Glacieibacterium frigidum]TRW14925.1 hypothetical protein FMM06_14780 [Glacieibacterium frigidum]